MGHRSVFVALVAAFALLAAACGDDDAASPADDTDPSTRYVEQVDDVMDGVNAAIVSIDRTLGGTYADRSALFGAFDASGLDAALSGARDEAAALTPPTSWEEDHRLFVATLEEADALATRVTAAIEANDIVEVATTVTELQVLQGTLTQQVSPRLCPAMSPELADGELDEVGRLLCTPVDDVADSSWSTATAANARRFFIEVVPRVTGIEPSFTQEEVARYLARIQPHVEAALTALADSQAAVDAPLPQESDQVVLIGFYADLNTLAGRISAAAADGAELQPLFDESGELVAEASAALSAETRALIAPMFHDA